MFQGLSLKNSGFLGSQGRSFRYWRFKNTSFGSNAIGTSMSEWNLLMPDLTTLVGKSIVNIGAPFGIPYPITELNDGFAETGNTSRIGYVSYADGYMDIYVDLGASLKVYGYGIAPQGLCYNTPLSFEAYGSNDAINWSLISTFNSISTGSPDWNPGTYRQFLF